MLFLFLFRSDDGRGTLGRRVSEKAGMEWSIGAWAVHPTLGLGFAPTTKARMRTEMLSIAAPDVVKVGETITVTATFHNMYNSDLITEITLHNTNQEFKFEQIGDPDSKPSKFRIRIFLKDIRINYLIKVSINIFYFKDWICIKNRN
jgi:hypothetical protein